MNRIAMTLGILLLGLFSPRLAAQKAQILKRLDDRSYAALTFKRGPHLDVRVGDHTLLTLR